VEGDGFGVQHKVNASARYWKLEFFELLKVTLIVQPLLRVYGTDEGRDFDNYDKARVWVPAEVWFNTK
jgi:hypothetical protein